MSECKVRKIDSQVMHFRGYTRGNAQAEVSVCVCYIWYGSNQIPRFPASRPSSAACRHYFGCLSPSLSDSTHHSMSSFDDVCVMNVAPPPHSAPCPQSCQQLCGAFSWDLCEFNLMLCTFMPHRPSASTPLPSSPPARRLQKVFNLFAG